MRLSDFTKRVRFSKRGFLKIFIPLMLILFITVALPAVAQDASGTKTGTINDVTAVTVGKPTITEIGDQAGHHKIAINIM